MFRPFKISTGPVIGFELLYLHAQKDIQLMRFNVLHQKHRSVCTAQKLDFNPFCAAGLENRKYWSCQCAPLPVITLPKAVKTLVYSTTVRLQCPVHLELCPSSPVDLLATANRPSIDDCMLSNSQPKWWNMLTVPNQKKRVVFPWPCIQSWGKTLAGVAMRPFTVNIGRVVQLVPGINSDCGWSVNRKHPSSSAKYNSPVSLVCRTRLISTVLPNDSR